VQSLVDLPALSYPSEWQPRDDLLWHRGCLVEERLETVINFTTNANVRDRIARAAVDLFGDSPFLAGHRVIIASTHLVPMHGVFQTNFMAGRFSQHRFFAGAQSVTRLLQVPGDIALSSEDVRTADCFSSAYQSAMRTSIRDLHNTAAKSILVRDRGRAI
jgi:hypothetical protein